tara:strand:- start:3 stop:170 length:168 start_codon:yes stop_codon:yes gene_type:complete
LAVIASEVGQIAGYLQDGEAKLLGDHVSDSPLPSTIMTAAKVGIHNYSVHLIILD